MNIGHAGATKGTSHGRSLQPVGLGVDGGPPLSIALRSLNAPRGPSRMPFTLSHAAAAIPFARVRIHRRLSELGVVGRAQRGRARDTSSWQGGGGERPTRVRGTCRCTRTILAVLNVKANEHGTPTLRHRGASLVLDRHDRAPARAPARALARALARTCTRLRSMNLPPKWPIKSPFIHLLVLVLRARGRWTSARANRLEPLGEEGKGASPGVALKRILPLKERALICPDKAASPGW